MKTQRRTPNGGRLSVREPGKHERERFEQLLKEKHPQQSPKGVGHELRVVVEEDGQWVALLRSTLFAIHQPHHEHYGGLNGFTEAVAADRPVFIRAGDSPVVRRLAAQSASVHCTVPP